MTDTHDDDLALQRALIDATQRLLDASRAIDPKESLKGIKSRRGIRRAHKHSVSHKSYR